MSVCEQAHYNDYTVIFSDPSVAHMDVILRCASRATALAPGRAADIHGNRRDDAGGRTLRAPSLAEAMRPRHRRPCLMEIAELARRV